MPPARHMNRESEFLKKWSLDATVPASFNSAVWRRIEARRRVSVPEAILHWINELFARRPVAVAYLSIAVALGLAAGQVRASKVLQEREGQLQARYVQSVDPYFPRLTE